MSIICWDFFGGVPRFPILNPGPSQRVAPEGSYMYSIDIKVSKIDLSSYPSQFLFAFRLSKATGPPKQSPKHLKPGETSAAEWS